LPYYKGSEETVLKHNFVFPFLLITVCFLPGCWDFQSVDKIIFATTIGIDRGSDNTVNLSIQAPITQNALPAVITGGKLEKLFYLTTVNAKTVNQGFDFLDTMTARTLVINQNKSIIIGEEAARNDLKPLLDFLERDPQAPMQALVFVANGMTAEEVMKLEPVQNVLPGIMFISAQQSITKYDMTFFTQVWQIQQRLIHKTKDPFAPLIRVDQAHKLYVISGLAVFNGSKMAGKLTWNEAEVFGLLTGLSKAGTITFSLPDGEVTLRNIVGNTQIQVTMQDNKPFFKVNTAVKGAISEVTNGKTLISRQDTLRYQKIVAKEIRTRITDLIKKLQGYNSDLINFGEEFRVQHQDIWKKTDWKKVFPTVTFTVQVKMEIPRDGSFR
jgi:spore germination protein KC